jgi:hypothetical protein
MKQPLVAVGVVLMCAAALATTAIGRNSSNDGVRGPLVADSIACMDTGGTFHPQAWRVPPEFFDGYHCLFPATSPPSDADVQQATRRCTDAHRGEFMTILVADQVGYACTWLRS